MSYFPGISPITLDKTNGRVGIGKAPATSIEVSAGGQYGAGFPEIAITSYASLGAGGGLYLGRRSFGAAGAHGQVSSGQNTFFLYGQASDGSAWREIAAIGFVTDELITSTAAGGLITISTTARGTLTRTERARVNADGYWGFGVASPTALLHVAASNAARASLCKPHGAAPTSPVNGDEWTTTAGSFVHINGTTKTHVTVSSPATYTPSNVTTDRTYDANATTLEELADVVGTLIADLKLTGIIL